MADATPFAHRDALFAFSPDALWEKPEETEAHVNWAKGYGQALRSYSPRGAYINFLTDEGQDRVRESYQGNYDRLVQIKRQYDPTNLFRLNQNIKPYLRPRSPPSTRESTAAAFGVRRRRR